MSNHEYDRGYLDANEKWEQALAAVIPETPSEDITPGMVVEYISRLQDRFNHD